MKLAPCFGAITGSSWRLRKDMNSISFTQLIPVLQVAIGPAILISGVGLVLMLLTNRLGRTTDRVRELIREQRDPTTDHCAMLSRQIGMLFRRARLIRVAIALAGTSALLAAIMVMTLFISVLWQLDIGVLVTLLFMLCLVCLISSLAAFILDVQWTLRALRIELQRNGYG